MNWLHLLWIIPVSAFVGGQLTSWFERKDKYNLNDEEKDTLHNLWLRVTGAEKAVLAKIKAAL